jgi:hypothetical protein
LPVRKALHELCNLHHAAVVIDAPIVHLNELFQGFAVGDLRRKGGIATEIDSVVFGLHGIDVARHMHIRAFRLHVTSGKA